MECWQKLESGRASERVKVEKVSAYWARMKSFCLEMLSKKNYYHYHSPSVPLNVFTWLIRDAACNHFRPGQSFIPAISMHRLDVLQSALDVASPALRVVDVWFKTDAAGGFIPARYEIFSDKRLTWLFNPRALLNFITLSSWFGTNNHHLQA